MAKAERGKGAAAKRELTEALDAVQATSQTTIHKLKVLRTPKGEIE